ncbi:hypothetical protein [Taibaiella koreensis]|uniref:hypothetical protein n=1 Tax=Taibaiella koreensis TaxID=1268548 RepID=UPI0013C32F9A|nr:hypothetical protein [Taibaiella koreensis]
MKKIILISLLAVSGATAARAQSQEAGNDKELKERVLEEIRSNLDQRSQVLDANIHKLDARVSALDLSINETKDAREKADKLFLRVQALEDKQKAIEENELNIYQANFQSALVNLASMEREIKPLVLFNTTREFYNQLNEAANPMNYPGFRDWFAGFHDYVKKNKNQESTLAMSSNLLLFSGATTQYVPVVGPISSVLFAGMSTYVTSIGKKNKALREQSEKMMTLTMKVSQFAYDKGAVEQEWKLITAELQSLQQVYQKALNGDLSVVKVGAGDFDQQFARESDAEKRYQYLTELRRRAGEYVAAAKAANPKDWKADIYYRMMDVQSLKVRFGQLTFRISEHIVRYADLFDKYRNDDQIGARITNLESRLNTLKETFDKAFDPLDYINSASRMYKVG